MQLLRKIKISNVNLITVGQVLEIEDEKATTNTTEQAATSKANTTQTTTTVSASDGLSAEDAAAKEWIARRIKWQLHGTKWPILWSLPVIPFLFKR